MSYIGSTILPIVWWDDCYSTHLTSEASEEKKLSNENDNVQLQHVISCLEAQSVSSAPPSSPYSIGEVHTQTPVTHLDELSAFEAASSLRLSGPASRQSATTDAEKKRVFFERLVLTKEILFHCSFAIVTSLHSGLLSSVRLSTAGVYVTKIRAENGTELGKTKCRKIKVCLIISPMLKPSACKCLYKSYDLWEFNSYGLHSKCSRLFEVVRLMVQRRALFIIPNQFDLLPSTLTRQ